MNHAEYNQLREASLRRKLSPGEEARLREFLAAHPGTQGDWEADATLSTWLRQLPDAPISSNFTAQVLNAVERECRPSPARVPTLRRRIAAVLSRFGPARFAASAAILIVIGLLGYQHQAQATRERRARSVAEVSALAADWINLLAAAETEANPQPRQEPPSAPPSLPVPELETLQDFEVIRALSLVDRGLFRNLE